VHECKQQYWQNRSTCRTVRSDENPNDRTLERRINCSEVSKKVTGHLTDTPTSCLPSRVGLLVSSRTGQVMNDAVNSRLAGVFVDSCYDSERILKTTKRSMKHSFALKMMMLMMIKKYCSILLILQTPRKVVVQVYETSNFQRRTITSSGTNIHVRRTIDTQSLVANTK